MRAVGRVGGRAARQPGAYFIEGNAGDERFHRSIYIDRLFQEDGALAALNAAYWSKALALTDVYDFMPQARRDEWNEAIKTILQLLATAPVPTIKKGVF